MFESINNYLPPTIITIVSLLLGYSLNILFLKPKARSEAFRDFLIKRNAALQNLVYFIDFLLATKGRKENIGNFNVRDHLIKENLCNSVFFPNKIKKDCDKVLELIYHITEQDIIEEKLKVIDLIEIRDNIRKYLDSK